MAPRILLCAAFLGLAHFVEAQTLTVAKARYASTSGARAVAAGDFDGNGWPDLAHANFGRDTVTVLLNGAGGKPGLGAAHDVAVGAGPFDMVAADVDLNGTIDLVVANADGHTLSVLAGRGDGTFSRRDLPAPGGPRAVTAADMNHDGRPDLIYTAYYGNRIQVLLGDGRGGFAAGPAIAGHSYRPQGVAAADFNRDGTLDLAVAYASATGGLSIVTMSAAGRPAVAAVDGPDQLNLVAAADFDADGWMDAAAASTFDHRLEIFLGSAGGLRHAATYSTGASPRGLRAADLNQDGRIDLVTADRESGTVTVFLWRGDPAARFDSQTFQAGRGSRDLAIADFNHDGRMDLATGNQDETAVSVLYNETSFVRAAYVFSREAMPAHENFSSEPVRVRDLNHNAIPDIVADSYVLLDRTTLRPLPPLTRVRASADLNADGHVDLVAEGYMEPPRAWLNDGRGAFTPDAFLPAPSWSQSIDLADMNRDGSLDLLVSTYSFSDEAGTLEIFLRRPDGTWAAAGRTPLPSWTLSVTVGDLNRDGRLDVVTTYYQPARLDVFLGDGGGRLSAPRSYPLPDYASGVALGDIDHDGAPDVIAGGWEFAAVFTGSRSGRLTPREVLTINGFGPKLADMNLDGHLDLVVAHTAILAGDGAGGFSPPEAFETGAFYSTVADLDLDGLPDLVAEGIAIYNQRNAVNRAPSISLPADFAIDYAWQYADDEAEVLAEALDPDLHALSFEWTDASGTIVSTSYRLPLRFTPGTHRFVMTVRDNRGGMASGDVTVTIRPNPELVLRYFAPFAWFYAGGSWQLLDDPTAADGVRAHDPDLGSPRLQAPHAQPASFFEVSFVADPTQVYKLWVRGKAAGNHWANDSVWLQFTGATNVAGTPVYRLGTASGLAVNLEECSGCGMSGWGWRDERWGDGLRAEPVLLRFPGGGYQSVVVQSREDGFSIDQIVLSAARFLDRPPGPARDDSTIVPHDPQ